MFTGLVSLLLDSAQRAPWGWALFVLVLCYLIRIGPVIQLQVINAKTQLRGEKRQDLKDCKERLDEMDIELSNAKERIHQLEMKTFGTVTAYRVLEQHTEANDPFAEALAQARLIFSEVWNRVSISDVPPDMRQTANKI